MSVRDTVSRPIDNSGHIATLAQVVRDKSSRFGSQWGRSYGGRDAYREDTHDLCRLDAVGRVWIVVGMTLPDRWTRAMGPLTETVPRFMALCQQILMLSVDTFVKTASKYRGPAVMPFLDELAERLYRRRPSDVPTDVCGNELYASVATTATPASPSFGLNGRELVPDGMPFLATWLGEYGYFSVDHRQQLARQREQHARLQLCPRSRLRPWPMMPRTLTVCSAPDDGRCEDAPWFCTST